MAYERPSIVAMRGYVPGKQPDAPGVIKLNTNENPYPPCSQVLEALARISPDALRRYPPPAADALRARAADVHGVTPDQIVAVNGGDELLRLAVTTFVEPGAAVGMLDPSYSLYPVLAEIHGSPVVRVPCADDWTCPSDLAAHMNGASVRLLFVVNPHAPSGRLASASNIATLARDFRGVLLVDEAYVDFVEPDLEHDLVPLTRERDNVLLLRTFSKGYSLAGLRVGYGIGHPTLVAPMLSKTRDSYNLDAIAQRLACTALEHRSEAAETWCRVREERARLAQQLHQLGCDTARSQANFLLVRLPAGRAAAEVQRALEARGILVRYFDEPRLHESLRITIGTPEEDDRLLAVLGDVLRT